VRIIVSGGGTGGHIYPAVTIANQIKELQPDAEIIFVGTREGLESDIVPRYGYPIEYIEVAGFQRKISFDTIKSAFKLLSGLKDAFMLIRRIKPDLVIGTGGYVCGPVLFLAALQGIPSCIQEQNAMPGVTNKILSFFVKKVFLGYEEAKKFFGGSSQKIFTGNPIRKEIIDASRSIAVKIFNLDPAKRTILVSGGSRGARSINNAMVAVENALAGRKDVQVIHITGEAVYEKFIGQVEKSVLMSDNIKVFRYMHEMPLALAMADLAVFRSGAIGLAELTARGIPSILVPYPYATANHQEHNARAIEGAGAAVVILDKELTGEVLLKHIESLMNNESKLNEMKKAAKVLGKPNAAEDIAQRVLALVRN